MKIGTVDERYGKWTVIGVSSKTKTGCIKWLCRCDCGKEKDVAGYSLRRGQSMSCGCVNFVNGNSRRGARVIEYGIWLSMKRRCLVSSSNGFKDYGGRGIKIYPEWVDSYDKFFEYIGPRPSSRHSIDRINNNGDYEPGNVQWATPDQQQKNRRNNRLITFNGKTQTITDWARQTGLLRPTIAYRLKVGHTIEDALSTRRLNYGDH